MKAVELQYLEHPNLALRFLELEEIVKFKYEKNWSLFAEEYEQLYQKSFYWRQFFIDAKRPGYIALNKSLNKNKIECLDGFYAALSKLSKPKIKGKALRDKKKRSGQKAYQREQLGDGFIDNPPLISAAKKAALALADDDAGEDEIAAKALELALKLATSPDRLAYIKQKLATNRLSKPLFNTELFTKHLEDGYHQAYQQYLEKMDATVIYVSK